jgi:hypothetical protein
MLTANLNVTSNAGSITLPGNVGVTVFAQITGTGNSTSILRRVSATAGTTPQTLTIGHTLAGTGFNQRLRSVVRMDYKALNTDIADTGGVTPTASFYSVLDRPIQSGGAITDAIIQNLIGGQIHVIVASGQLAQLMNQEA